jgi:predicted PurR-regulated permease PerM
MSEAEEPRPEADPDDHEAPGLPVRIAFDHGYLRRTLLLIFAAIVMFQIVMWSWSLLGRFAFNILLAWLVAISFDPVVSWLAHKGMRRGAATAVVAIAVLAILGGFIALFGGILATQIADLVLALPGLVLDIVDWINSTFDARIDPDQIIDNLSLTSAQITEIASGLAGGILGVLAGVVSVIVDFITVVVFAFYFSADSPRI